MASLKWVTIVLLQSVSLQVALGQFLDPGYFDIAYSNPLFAMWNTNTNSVANPNRIRDPTVQEVTRACTVVQSGSTETLEGTCMNSAACRFQRGKSSGRGTCSVWNTCCVFEKISNQTSNARVTYFRHTPNARDLPQAQRIYVNLANNQICQMRVDIIELQIEKPNPLTLECNLDYLEFVPRSSDMTPICGTNKNTHFYIHLNQDTIINNGIILRVHTDMAGTIEPRWNIKITQLECPGARNIIEMHQNKYDRNQVVNDFHSLAPNGCLQYYPNPSGIIKSFGYNTAMDAAMTIPLDYAICFKPTTEKCTLTLTPIFMNLPNEPPTTCVSYIYVPEATAEKVCPVVPGAIGTPPVTLITTHPGPHYIHVHTEGPVPPVMVPAAQFGFEISYTMKCE